MRSLSAVLTICAVLSWTFPCVAQMPQLGEGAEARGKGTVSDPALTAMIGMTKPAFLKDRPGAICVSQGPGIELCTYTAPDQVDCPVRLICAAPIYGFRRGRLTSYQADLQFEDDWQLVYRFALEHYTMARSVTTTTGTSAFFNTRSGVLILGHNLGVANALPVWALRFYLPRPDTRFE